jgi:hypothetical protein
MMTEAHLAPCPKCGVADSIDLSDGVRLCLQCRTEWRPADVVALVATDKRDPVDVAEGWGAVGEILHARTADDVLNVPPDPAPTDTPAPLIPARRLDAADDWAGEFVRRDDGRTFLVINDDGGVFVGVQTADGAVFSADRSTLTLLGDEPVGPGEVIHAGGDDEPLPAVMLAVAAAAITVAVDSIGTNTEGEQTITSPRIGWLPPPCDQVPEVEVGVAYAIAALILAFGLDRGEVVKLAANLMTGAEAGAETETDQ